MKFTYQMPDWKNKGDAPSENLKETGFVAGNKPPANIFNWFWGLITDAIKEIQTKLTSVDDNKATKTEIIPTITAYSELERYYADQLGREEETGYTTDFSVSFRAKGQIFGGTTEDDEALCVMNVTLLSSQVGKQNVTVIRGTTITEYSRYFEYAEDSSYVETWDEFALVDNYAKVSMFTCGTEDLVAGTSNLETGKLYFVYE